MTGETCISKYMLHCYSKNRQDCTNIVTQKLIITHHRVITIVLVAIRIYRCSFAVLSCQIRTLIPPPSHFVSCQVSSKSVVIQLTSHWNKIYDQSDREGETLCVVCSEY